MRSRRWPRLRRLGQKEAALGSGRLPFRDCIIWTNSISTTPQPPHNFHATNSEQLRAVVPQPIPFLDWRCLPPHLSGVLRVVVQRSRLGCIIPLRISTWAGGTSRSPVGFSMIPFGSRRSRRWSCFNSRFVVQPWWKHRHLSTIGRRPRGCCYKS